MNKKEKNSAFKNPTKETSKKNVGKENTIHCMVERKGGGLGGGKKGDLNPSLKAYQRDTGRRRTNHKTQREKS